MNLLTIQATSSEKTSKKVKIGQNRALDCVKFTTPAKIYAGKETHRFCIKTPNT